jgi:hypothetical protein
MSNYHSFFEHVRKSELNFINRKSRPSLFFIHPHPSIFRQISGANLMLIKLIQKNADLIRSLQSVYEDWKVTTVVHGDMKWDNIIISDLMSKSRNVFIVDWELAEFGDPAWDLAGIFHDFITYWINLVSQSRITNIENLTIPTNESVEVIKNHMRTFWRGYITTKNLSNIESNNLLLKTAKYCAGRLLQKIYEMYQYSPSLSNNAFFMLQASSNIIQNTEDAIIHLFGIPFRFVN